MAAIGAEEKKKIYVLLGLAGVLGSVVLFVIKPFGGRSSSTTTSSTVVSSTPSPTPAVATAQTVSLATTSTPTAGTPGSGIPSYAPGASAGTTRLVALGRYRRDPFAPKVVPAGAPLPPPPTPRPTPKPLPPVDIPTPSGDFALPPATIEGPERGAASRTGGVPLDLPPVNIGQFKPRTSPRPLLASSASGGATSGTNSGPVASNDKRLAGVVIGDSVRALIEINNGSETITRVVKPGDEVEGVKILSIQRLTENGAVITRMTVLENGQQRYFDLRPATGQ